MLSKTFNLLFYLKKPKNYVNGKMPIYLILEVFREHNKEMPPLSVSTPSR